MMMADVSVITDLMQEEEKRIKDYLKTLGNNFKAKGVGGKVKSCVGNPGEVIVRVAKEEGATFIVTGTRGMGTIRRTLLGSISDYIIHHSHIPVLVGGKVKSCGGNPGEVIVRVAKKEGATFIVTRGMGTIQSK